MTSNTIINYFQTNTELLKKYKVSKIGLFGSYSRGQQTANSDVDLIVEYIPGGKSFDNFIRLIDSLETAFQKKVEVVTTESISESFYNHIKSEIKYVQINY